MNPVNFPTANKLLLAPVGMENECGDLPVFNDGRESISVWELSEQEIEQIVKSRKILLGVLAGASMPPVRLAVYIEPEESDVR